MQEMPANARPTGKASTSYVLLYMQLNILPYTFIAVRYSCPESTASVAETELA